MASQKQKDLFSDLVYVALLDNNVQREDMELLARYGHEIGLSKTECVEVINDVQAGKKKTFSNTEDELEQLAMFERFVAFALIDGDVDDKELIFLDEMAGHYGLDDEEVDAIIEEAMEERDAAWDD